MNYEIAVLKLTNMVVKWTFNVPRSFDSVRSTSFDIHGCKWYLQLISEEVAWSLYWILKLHYLGIQVPPHIHLKVYIRSCGEDFFLCEEEIISESTIVCQSIYSDFRDKYPSPEAGETRLELKFDFQLRIPHPESPFEVKSVQTDKTFQTHEKSVQTSDPNTAAIYPENHPCLENLSLDFSKLVEDDTDTDVQLKCGDVSIRVHKLILNARSEVFRTMMHSDMMEGREGIVEIIDMEPKILKILIRYIYTGMLPELTVDTALPIYEVADKYQVEALKKRSSHFLAKNMSPENALTILVAADAHSDTDLKGQLISYISDKKIPTRKAEWQQFCNQYPMLATEVLNFMIYQVFPVTD